MKEVSFRDIKKHSQSIFYASLKGNILVFVFAFWFCIFFQCRNTSFSRITLPFFTHPASGLICFFCKTQSAYQFV
ncbi:unnamed protein product [Larinioides sclopetarius]|uniref:Uncharacterized protein n=1 Tax=Larinioides sclopetarius TaxID=280406 RepID=A0AAV1ZRU5_9ARAC